MGRWNYPIISSGIIWNLPIISNSDKGLSIAQKLADDECIYNLLKEIFDLDKKSITHLHSGKKVGKITPLECIHISYPQFSIKLVNTWALVRPSISVPKEKNKCFKVWIRIKLEDNTSKSLELSKVLDIFQQAGEIGKNIVLKIYKFLVDQYLPNIGYNTNSYKKEKYDVNIYVVNTNDPDIRGLLINEVYREDTQAVITAIIENSNILHTYFNTVERAFSISNKFKQKKWLITCKLDEWFVPSIGLFRVYFTTTEGLAVGVGYYNEEEKTTFIPSLYFAQVVRGMFSKNV